MKTCDRVRVYPHGSPEDAVTGKVLLISSNLRSIAVAFPDCVPPFLQIGDGLLVHLELGPVLLAMRAELNGAPWGPWVDVTHGGHFEIEEELCTSTSPS